MPDTTDNQPGPEKRRRGRPFPKGVSGNPGGQPRAETPEPADDGVVTAARMRKVLGQPEALDRGPTETQLRRWLGKDPKGYTEAIDRKAKAEGEDAGLRARCERLEREAADKDRRIAELEAEVERLGKGERVEQCPRADDVMGMIRRQLKEIGDRSAIDGRCVTCGQPVAGRMDKDTTLGG